MWVLLLQWGSHVATIPLKYLLWHRATPPKNAFPALSTATSSHVSPLPPFRYLSPLCLLLCLLPFPAGGRSGWLGLYIMPDTMKEIMKPVETVVSKNQFSWRAEWPRVLVAAEQATGTSSLVRPWGTGSWWVLLERTRYQKWAVGAEEMEGRSELRAWVTWPWFGNSPWCTVSSVSERGRSTPAQAASCWGAQAGSPALGACGKTSKPRRSEGVRINYSLPLSISFWLGQVSASYP